MPTDAANEAEASPADAEAPATDDLETARKAVEDTAAIGGGLWLSYLFVLLYLGIAAGAVTHADLLLQAPVKLPFLNIELPLLAFFLLAPQLLLLTHAYTLVHLVLLARRIAQFNAIKGLPEAWRRRLPSNIFVQFLGAPEEDRYDPFGLLLGAILWVTLVVAPIALYLLLEIQLLPYHSRLITWTNRAALFLDLLLLWWLWRIILASRARRRRAHAWKTVVKMTAGALLTPLVVLFAWGVATIPGEWQEDHFPGKSALAWARERLFDGDVDRFTRHRASLFSSTLVLPAFNIYEALKIDYPKKLGRGCTAHRSSMRSCRARRFTARLWRAQLTFAAKDLFAPPGSPDWNPAVSTPTPVGPMNRQPWTDATFAALRQSIEQAVPEGPNRNAALERVAILDCARKDGNLASCDPAADPPNTVKEWKKMIEAAPAGNLAKDPGRPYL